MRTSGAGEGGLRDELSGADAGGVIGLEHLFDRRRRGGRGMAQHLFDCTRDAEEGNATFEEGGDGDLVGGVEGDAGGGAPGGLVGEAEAGEAVEVGRREVEAGELGEVEGEGGRFPG